MPKVKVPKFKHKSASELKKPVVPFKLRVVSYAGEDKAYMKFKQGKLLDETDHPLFNKRSVLSGSLCPVNEQQVVWQAVLCNTICVVYTVHAVCGTCLKRLTHSGRARGFIRLLC